MLCKPSIQAVDYALSSAERLFCTNVLAMGILLLLLFSLATDLLSLEGFSCEADRWRLNCFRHYFHSVKEFQTLVTQFEIRD